MREIDYLIGYLIIINLITLVIYVREAKHPALRQPVLVLVLLPIIGGSLGAIIANYFWNVEHRELRCHVSTTLGFLPPAMFIIQFVLAIVAMGLDNSISYVWHFTYEGAGILGCVLLIVNVLSFALVFLRKLSDFVVSYEETLVSDKVLVPVLILGGATGGVLAKILFNFKEDWSTNCTKRIENFLYNWGMFFIALIQIGLFVCSLYLVGRH